MVVASVRFRREMTRSKGVVAYVYYVAWTWPFHLSLISSFVSWLTIPHPVDHSRSIIRHRSWKSLLLDLS
jgi:hypothetical protein